MGVLRKFNELWDVFEVPKESCVRQKELQTFQSLKKEILIVLGPLQNVQEDHISLFNEAEFLSNGPYLGVWIV